VALQKTAIAVPAALLAEIDEAARERSESRNRLINRILGAAMRARSDADVTRRLDELFADPSVADEQRRSARSLDDAGTAWDDESW
jgi:hypothetical protein